MIDSDKKSFMDLMNVVADSYNTRGDGSTRPSPDVLSLWFMLLEDYSLEAVQWAVRQHMKSPTGQFIPKPADIIKFIDGPEITSDQILAHARNPITPLGVFARMKIGSFDLDKQNHFYLKERAEEIKLIIPQLKQKIKNGDLSDNELIVFDKYGVNPQKPFVDGMPPVKIENLSNKLIEAKSRVSRRNEAQVLLSDQSASDCSESDIEEAKAVYKNLSESSESKEV